jgi:hypothetical protein
VTLDSSLPFFAAPASDDESYVVRGRMVGRFVEISLSRDSRERHRFRSDSYTPIELLALKRFRPAEVSAYTAYAGELETAADVAARGELGYTVHTVSENGQLRIALIARLLTADGRVQTEISHEHSFEDPDSQVVLVQANEKATEIRAEAQGLNDKWVSARAAQLLELRAGYDEADAQAKAGDDLQRIVDAEGA